MDAAHGHNLVTWETSKGMDIEFLRLVIIQEDTRVMVEPDEDKKTLNTIIERLITTTEATDPPE